MSDDIADKVLKTTIVTLVNKMEKRISELEGKFKRWIGHDVSNMCDRIIELEKTHEGYISMATDMTKHYHELKEQFMEFIKFRTMNDQKPMINELKKDLNSFEYLKEIHFNDMVDDLNELKKVVAGYHGNILKIMDDNDELKEWVENWCSSVIKEHNELKGQCIARGVLKELITTVGKNQEVLRESIDMLRGHYINDHNHTTTSVLTEEALLVNLLEKLGGSEKKECDHFFVTIKDNKEGCTFCGIIKDSGGEKPSKCRKEQTPIPAVNGLPLDTDSKPPEPRENELISEFVNDLQILDHNAYEFVPYDVILGIRRLIEKYEGKLK